MKGGLNAWACRAGAQFAYHSSVQMILSLPTMLIRESNAQAANLRQWWRWR